MNRPKQQPPRKRRRNQLADYSSYPDPLNESQSMLASSSPQTWTAAASSMPLPPTVPLHVPRQALSTYSAYAPAGQQSVMPYMPPSRSGVTLSTSACVPTAFPQLHVNQTLNLQLLSSSPRHSHPSNGLAGGHDLYTSCHTTGVSVWNPSLSMENVRMAQHLSFSRHCLCHLVLSCFSRV